MKFTMRVVTILAALSGHPIRLSSVPAPDNDPDSILIEPDPRKQINPSRTTRSHQGIAYSDGDRKLRMDILTPASPASPAAAGPHPLVLYLPGGGFVSARRGMAVKQRRYVAESGFVVASIDYRTTTTNATYRDGLMDVATALQYLRAHAAEYGIDPTRVAVWGESAGAYLAAMAATEPDNKLNAAIDVFGASNLAEVAKGFDSRTVDAFIGPKAAVPAYILGRGRKMADHPDEIHQADPATRVTARTPPFLLLHGDDDRVIAPAQTAHLHQALRAAGVESTRYVLKGAGHGELSDHPEMWNSTDVMDLIVEFLRAKLA